MKNVKNTEILRFYTEILSFSGEQKTKFEWAKKTYDFIVQHYTRREIQKSSNGSEIEILL